MAIRAAREAWTDERLDDLNRKVDDGFREMKEEFRAVRGEMKEEFGAVRGEMREEFAVVRGEMKEEFGAGRGEMKEGFDRIDEQFNRIGEHFHRVDDRMAATQQVMIQICFAMVAAMLGGFLTVLAAIFVQA